MTFTASTESWHSHSKGVSPEAEVQDWSHEQQSYQLPPEFSESLSQAQEQGDQLCQGILPVRIVKGHGQRVRERGAIAVKGIAKAPADTRVNAVPVLSVTMPAVKEDETMPTAAVSPEFNLLAFCNPESYGGTQWTTAPVKSSPLCAGSQEGRI